MTANIPPVHRQYSLAVSLPTLSPSLCRQFLQEKPQLIEPHFSIYLSLAFSPPHQQVLIDRPPLLIARRSRGSMFGRDPWGGSLEINAADSATDDERSRNLQDYDRAALSSRQLDETQQSWLLGPAEQKKKKKYVDLGCIIVSRKIFVWTVGTILAAGLLAGFIALIVKLVPRHHHGPPPPDNYTQALHKALMFFNAQRCMPFYLFLCLSSCGFQAGFYVFIHWF